MTWTRDDSWAREKQAREKWVRFQAEVPPELAEALKEAQRKSLGVNYDGYLKNPTNATRAAMVRAGLRLYLNKVDPEAEPAIDVEAVEIVDLKELPPPLHVGDCPMTNSRPEDRTECACDSYPGQERDYLEGGGGIQAH